MTIVEAVPAAPPRARPWSLRAIIWLVAAAAFVGIDWHLANNGYVRDDLTKLLNQDGAADGVWLSALLLRTLGWLSETWAQGALSLIAAVVAGLIVALMFANLRRNGWQTWRASALVLLLAGNALTLYAITAASNAIPLIFACALVVPSIRRLESVGDVQAEMGFGMVLPLFLLAGPLTTPLVPVLAALSALTDPEARRDFRAFIAMFLVAILPSMIVLFALLTMHFDQGRTFADFLAPYSNFYGREEPTNWIGALTDLLLLAPVALVPILYCLKPDRRMQPWSALAVVAIPLYLVLGRLLFGWHVEAWAPAAALLGGFFAWLSVARLQPSLRAIAVALIGVSAVASWVFADSQLDAEWKRALLAGAPAEQGEPACGQRGEHIAECLELRGYSPGAR